MENAIDSADAVTANAPAATGPTEISVEPATPTTPVGSKSRKETCKDEDDAGDEAIVRCMKAWNYAYKKEAANIDEGESDYPAEKKANEAYLRDTPPLVGLKNICQFIACINFASMTGIIRPKDATHYMANARVALAALSLLPKPQATGPKSLGKPSTTSAGGAGE
jgi:hypothetical protein